VGEAPAGPVALAAAGGVLTLTLDRAEKRNALNAALVDAIHGALDRADLDPDVRVLVVRGAGRDFCAGADLEELLASADLTPAQNEASARRLGDLFTRIRRLPKPVVARVHGRALAGGAGLATACDLVIAGAGAQLGYPEVQRGFVPAMVATILRRLAGEKAALDLLLTGRVIGAEEARALGLVSRVVPDDALDAAVHDVAGGLAAGAVSALALTKRLFMELDGLGFEDGIALGARVNAVARQTPEYREAIGRFLRR
jgi:methylglutaconyl-CoA hydratase